MRWGGALLWEESPVASCGETLTAAELELLFQVLIVQVEEPSVLTQTLPVLFLRHAPEQRQSPQHKQVSLGPFSLTLLSRGK